MLFLCPLGAERSNTRLAGLQMALAMIWLFASLKRKDLNQAEDGQKDIGAG